MRGEKATWACTEITKWLAACPWPVLGPVIAGSHEALDNLPQGAAFGRKQLFDSGRFGG